MALAWRRDFCDKLAKKGEPHDNLEGAMFLKFIHALGKMPAQDRAALIALVKSLGLSRQKGGEQDQVEFSGLRDQSSSNSL